MSEEMTNQERLDKVARDLRANRQRLVEKIEAQQVEIENDKEMLKNFDVAVSTLEAGGAAKDVPEAPLPVAAGAVEPAAPAAANDGVQGTDANGSPV